ncbi:MAG: barstar family protein [Verrucomicrobiaceae bacterium]|nr:barstar family protein [Verrucomicrobiaceae bacterium]
MQKREFQIDGTQFSDLQEFFDQISEHLIPGAEWGRNLDAFNDILRGGFGTPDEGFILVWLNSAESKKRLGYDETQSQLERRLQRCHPTNRDDVAMDLEQAKRHEGSTVFDWLVEIIEAHCEGGDEAEDGVELRLE